MVEPEAQVAAELAYQRALSALHEARAGLAEVTAARRRLAYEPQAAPDPVERDAWLAAREGELAGLEAELRQNASRLREELRRFGLPAEPVNVERDEPDGFEQPPFGAR